MNTRTWLFPLAALISALCSAPALSQSRSTTLDTLAIATFGSHSKNDACLPPCIDADSTDYVTRYRIVNYGIVLGENGTFTVDQTHHLWVYARTRHGRLLIFRSINREEAPDGGCYIVSDKKTARKFWRDLNRYIRKRWTVANYAGIDVKMAPVGALLDGELSHYRAIGDSTGQVKSPNRISYFYTAGFYSAVSVRAAEYEGPLFDIGTIRLLDKNNIDAEKTYTYKYSSYVKTRRGKRDTRVVTSGGKQVLLHSHDVCSDPKMMHL